MFWETFLGYISSPAFWVVYGLGAVLVGLFCATWGTLDIWGGPPTASEKIGAVLSWILLWSILVCIALVLMTIVS